MRKYYLVLFMLLVFCMLRQSVYAQSKVPSEAHRAREAEYDLNFFFPDLDIESNSTFISGNVLMRATVLAPTLDTFAVELDSSFTLDLVLVCLNNGVFVTATAIRDGQEVNVLLPFTAHAGDVVQVRFYYAGNAVLSNTMFYYYENEFASITEPYCAYMLFPCKQVLTDKADSSWFNITTSDSAMAVSNGVLNNTVNLGHGKQRWEWRSHHAIDYYLVSFAVGRFHLSNFYFHPDGRTDSMQVQFYGYTNLADTFYSHIADTALHIYSKLFGLYPFYDEKLSFAEAYYGTSMENQTAITTIFNPTDVVHELAHQWFGDNVTCASFKDIMVNEGFAHWCESIYAEFSSGGDPARIAYYNQEEQNILGSTCGSGYDTYDTSSLYGAFDYNLDYGKNGMMINTLRFLVNNDSLFFQGLRNYQTQFHASTAYGADLRDVMEATTGRNLTGFFNQFFYGHGYPLFTYRWNEINDTLFLRVNEKGSCDSTPLFVTPLQIRLLTTTGDTIIKVMIEDTVSDFIIPMLDGSFRSLRFDPNQWILNATGPYTGIHDTALNESTVHPVNTGITPIAANSHYTVYPNPASSYITISSTGAPGTPIPVVLFNTLGQQVYQTKITNGGRINLPALANGVYILQLNGDDRVRVEIVR